MVNDKDHNQLGPKLVKDPLPTRQSSDVIESVEGARVMYRPAEGIKVVFVAEAPPANPQRFFYFDKVDSHNSLFLALMRLLYDDAREEPMPANALPRMKCRLLTAALDSLIEKLHGLVNEETRIVLISSAVHSVCLAPLKTAGFNVINTEMIDFPASGRQAHFERKLGRLLGEFLRRVRGRPTNAGDGFND